jgi:hypothetical protein
MKPFIFQNWHAWDGTAGVLLSDEDGKDLREFKNTDDCINWLYLNNHKDAARALNAHVKDDAITAYYFDRNRGGWAFPKSR